MNTGKHRKEIAIGVVLIIVIGVASWFISIGIVRGIAGAFAKPDPHKWEWVYISTSPRAYSYHHKDDCKYLRRTNHSIEFIPIDDAEDIGRTPCGYCLEKSRKHQYDNVVWYVVFPVFFLLVGFIALVERMIMRRKKPTENSICKNAYPEKILKAKLQFFENHKGDRKTWLDTITCINDEIDDICLTANNETIIDNTTTKRAIELSDILSQSGYMNVQTVEKLKKLEPYVDFGIDDSIVRKIIITLAESKEQLFFSISMQYVNDGYRNLKKMMYVEEKENAIHQAHIDDVNRTIRKLVDGK